MSNVPQQFSGIAFGNESLAQYDEGTWTPTVSSETGTLTSSTINTAKYTRVGNVVTVNLDITITNAGTGAAGLVITLPIAPANRVSLAGREDALTGAGLSISALTSGNLYAYKYDNTTIIATGRRVYISGSYIV